MLQIDATSSQQRKLSLEVSTDSVVIGTLASSAIAGITYVAATQSDINVTCIATAGVAFITYITLSLFIPDPSPNATVKRRTE